MSSGPTYEIGERIRLEYMPDDPDPIPVGTEGIINWVSEFPMDGQHITQLGVDWDNGRRLLAVIPPDRVTKL